MNKIKIISVVGARPNFMKIAPILREFENNSKFINSYLLHTGQHYDQNMSQTFFDELGIKSPNFNLSVGSSSHAVQTAKIMEKSELIFLEEKPDLVVVVGDVNSTLACTVTAKKLGIKVAHIEAGLRSFDMTMPEEINRKLTDCISDILFTTSIDANENLLKEGINKKNIYHVGNCMIDSLVYQLSKLSSKNTIINKPYAVLTLHRPSNVDSKENLESLINVFNTISKDIPIYFPIHPRTLNQMEKFGLNSQISKNIHMSQPLSYIDFLKLYKDAAIVLTDSGGIQEETTYLNIPCITLRENTERPVTIKYGTNHLVGINPKKIISSVKICLSKKQIKKRIKYWDGNAAKRITKIIIKNFFKIKKI